MSIKFDFFANRSHLKSGTPSKGLAEITLGDFQDWAVQQISNGKLVLLYDGNSRRLVKDEDGVFLKMGWREKMLPPAPSLELAIEYARQRGKANLEAEGEEAGNCPYLHCPLCKDSKNMDGSRSMPPPVEPERTLIGNLMAAQVASCRCEAKSHDVRAHVPACPYRVIQTAIDAIRKGSAIGDVIHIVDIPLNTPAEGYSTLDVEATGPDLSRYDVYCAECRMRGEEPIDFPSWLELEHIAGVESILGNGDHVVIDFVYTNHKGECRARRAHPLRLFWGTTEWHPEPGWKLEAHDLVKHARRTFAVKSMNPVKGGKVSHTVAENSPLHEVPNASALADNIVASIAAVANAAGPMAIAALLGSRAIR